LTVTVCRLVAGDWQSYRAIRLAMLLESPAAFGSTHEEALGYDEPAWRQRLTDNAVLLARVGPAPAGSAMYSDFGTTEPGDCALYGMWVDPRFRRSGAGRALISAVVEQARAAGKRRVVLRVVSDNAAARTLYESEGFTYTGHSVPHPNGEGLTEVEMELVVGDSFVPRLPV
jgi:ribosomal protein S18 acetylase RimI-like enzyme